MIRTYKEFEAIMLRWMLKTYGTTPDPDPKVTYARIEPLYLLLGLDEIDQTD